MSLAADPLAAFSAAEAKLNTALSLAPDDARSHMWLGLDPSFGRHTDVPLDEAALHLDRAAHGVDHAAELDERAVAGALDDAPMVRGDRRVDEVASQSPQPRQRAIFVGASQTAVSDDVSDQDRRKLPSLAHSPSSAVRDQHRSATKT